MADEYYGRRHQQPLPPDLDRLSASFAKLFMSGGGSTFGGRDNNILTHQPAPPYIHHNPRGDSNVITQQPFGQLSNTSSLGMIPLNWCPPQVPMSPHVNVLERQSYPSQNSHQGNHPHPPEPPPPIGIPLPGLDILDTLPFIKITDAGIFSGSYTCSPSYSMFNPSGELILKATTSKLFCPFDARMKTLSVMDTKNACLFQIKFLPSLCICDSEEKRCFAVYSPLYDSPFGAILFEAGQLKYSLRIINALEGETLAIQFISSTDISVVGADGRILAIINIVRKRGQATKYSMTLTEDVSTANKALFLACILTLDLVRCEGACSKCICICPFLLGSLTILGLTLASYWDPKTDKVPKL